MVKQRITIDQLNELTDEQKQRLREWWKPQGSDIYYNTHFKTSNSIRVNEYTNIEAGNIQNSLEGQNWLRPLLSIGQMIELLQDKVACFNMSNMFARTDNSSIGLGVFKPKSFDIRADELCDALWETVKKLL